MRGALCSPHKGPVYIFLSMKREQFSMKRPIFAKSDHSVTQSSDEPGARGHAYGGTWEIYRLTQVS